MNLPYEKYIGRFYANGDGNTGLSWQTWIERNKSRFYQKKYRSILRAAIIVEAVNFIVSLTDGIVAGNVLGADAFAAIGLLAPFLSISTFLASIVNTGTVLNYSYEIGKFNKRCANEFFSQGVIAALLVGALKQSG